MPWFRLWLGLSSAALASAQTQQLPPFAVTASRGAAASATPLFPTRLLSAETLAHSATVDAALRSDPAFSLFRRSDSLAAHPTAQGVSLRGIGPSGASRSLVLLDGVPLNDPFGGWVAWSQLAPLSLAGAEIRHGGGSAAWGNAALGGTIALQSISPAAQPNAARLTLGSLGTRIADLGTGIARGSTAVRIDARAFSTDGYHPLLPADRGAVDVPLAAEHRLAQLRTEHQLGPVTARLTLRHFTEDRTNGTRLQTNSTRLDFASLALAGRLRDADWSTVIYHQRQAFSSFFSSVAADRQTETPANNQFDVPADAFGGSLTVAGGEGSGPAWVVGTDYRQVRGETREDYLLARGELTRRRHAGGAQQFAGAFAALEHPWRDTWKGRLEVRADHWTNRHGHRREVDKATGAVLRDESFSRQSDWAWNGTAGLNWQATPAWSARAAASTAFRVPTLNELHRPFRVGNTNTEANPALTPEKLRSIEGGFDFRSGPLHAGLTVFYHRLDDAVANVTLASTPALVSRQRRNLSAARIQGVEGQVAWSVTRRLGLEGAFLFSDATVLRAEAQPSLLGRRLAQVPRVTLTAGARWQTSDALALGLRARWASRQFEDDENSLALPAAGTADLWLERQIGAAATIGLEVENLFDRAVAVARTSGGPTAFGAPRRVRGTVRLSW